MEEVPLLYNTNLRRRRRRRRRNTNAAAAAAAGSTRNWTSLSLMLVLDSFVNNDSAIWCEYLILKENDGRLFSKTDSESINSFPKQILRV